MSCYSVYTFLKIVYFSPDIMISLYFPDEICDVLREEGLLSELVISRTAGNEKLSVVKFYYPQ